MRASLEDWNNGWLEVEVGLTVGDIDRLIVLLQMIRSDADQHFHATTDFVGTGGIAQITFHIQHSDEVDNLILGGRALGSADTTEAR